MRIKRFIDIFEDHNVINIIDFTHGVVEKMNGIKLENIIYSCNKFQPFKLCFQIDFLSVSVFFTFSFYFKNISKSSSDGNIPNSSVLKICDPSIGESVNTI